MKHDVPWKFKSDSNAVHSLSCKEKKKIAFQLVLISLIGWLSGAFFSKFVIETFRTSIEQAVSIHFELPFRFVTNFYDVFLYVFRYAWPDLFVVCLIFLFAFTFFNLLLSEVVLLWQSVKVGTSTALLIQIGHFSTVSLAPSSQQIFIFIACHGGVLFLLGVYAFRAARFAFSIRGFKRGERFSLHPQITFRFLTESFAFSGVVVLIHVTYCLLIFLL